MTEFKQTAIYVLMQAVDCHWVYYDAFNVANTEKRVTKYPQNVR